MKQISAFALNNQAQIFSTLFLVWIEFQTIWSIFLIFMQISLDYTPPPILNSPQTRHEWKVQSM